MSSATDYSEAGERNRVAGQPLSHLSIEVGHFYMDELVDGADRIHAQLRKVAPIVQTQIAAAEAEFGAGARVSTCFLVDDYFWTRTANRPRDARRTADPRHVLEKLLAAAEECGVRIDYLAREAGCAEVPSFQDGEPVGEPVRLAEMMAARIVAEPERDSTGRRPPTVESGWLCNGRRSSEFDAGQAMRISRYRPPEEFGARNHSIFLDVQLWSRRLEEEGDQQVERMLWSCPFLAAIWQLLRLGLIRNEGAMVAAPVPWEEPWPSDWSRMPAVVKLNPKAKPFAAYRALSVLPYSYLGIEHAVRVILDHLQLDDDVQAKLAERGAGERIPVQVPRRATHRLNHVFLGDV
ncbi:SCO2522 family protein [Nocardia sp. NPDC059091]|uniref:SCO2522 family protein n=1 Tax=unclassified Nocardia TaxID=2637762 RepID=UPI0036D0A15A